MLEKLFVNLKIDLLKLEDMYNKEQNLDKKKNIYYDILKIQSLFEDIFNYEIDIDYKKDLNHYKSLSKTKFEIFTGELSYILKYKKDKDILLKFCVDNYYNLMDKKIFDFDEKLYNIKSLDINELFKLCNIDNSKFSKFVFDNIDKVYFSEKIDTECSIGNTVSLDTINKQYIVSINSPIVALHELAHLYQLKHNNYKSDIHNNKYSELFPSSMELIGSDLIDKKYKLMYLKILSSMSVQLKRENLCYDYEIKGMYGLIGGIVLYNQYLKDREKYYYNMDYYNKNYKSFQNFKDLRRIGITEDNFYDENLVKKLIKGI